MRTLSAISELPNVPAIYALYGGQNNGSYVAYVGLARQLKLRIIQHLVRRDSSVTTGFQAVSLNPDFVTKVEWWEHADFVDPSCLAAAELVAFDVLDPVLRSRGTIPHQAKQFYEDSNFNNKMHILIEGEPSGRLLIPTFQDALERIVTLENRIAELEQRIIELEKAKGKSSAVGATGISSTSE
jgi:hypothetical protein